MCKIANCHTLYNDSAMITECVKYIPEVLGKKSALYKSE